MSNSMSKPTLIVRAILGALACLVLSGGARAADCKSQQKGSEVFADTFADDSGGWTVGDRVSYGKPALALTLYDPYGNWVFPNQTFNASDGDYCTEVVLPKSLAPDNLTEVGLVTLEKDLSNFLLLQVSSKGDLILDRLVAGTWTTVEVLKFPGTVPPAGTVVTLRETVKGTLVTPWVNGVEMRKIRVQVPPGPLKFGLFVQTDKNPPKPGVTFQINNYRVTAGE
jgi:hypothetical protein